MNMTRTRPLPSARGLPWGLAGALALWLGFPNDLLSLPPLALLWPVALVMLGLRAPDRMAALRRGWLVSLAGGAAALYWLALPVHNVGGLPWLLAVPCALFIAACLASAGGLFSLAAHVLRARPPLPLALLLALLWYLLEACYALALGFPWLPLAGALAVWPPLVQAADTLGAYALGGCWLLAALLCLFSLPLASPSGPPATRRFFPRRLAAGLGLAALLLGYGAWRLHAHPFEASPAGADSMAVLFVEGNVDQNQKWLPAFQRQTVDLYLNLTRAGLAARPAADAAARQDAGALIVWPETALPFFFETRPSLAKLVRDMALTARSPLLFGAPGVERRPGQAEPLIFNRAFLLGPDGETVGHYDKEHLVPFGEYLPEWLNWGFLQALLQGVGVYEKGAATAPLRHGNLALGMLICYEGIFPWLAQARTADGANILADISNDGWFGNSPAARQHLYLTALRALEQNRWILRGTNTGISAVVDSRGRVTARGDQFQTGTLWARAGLTTAASAYHRLAPWLLPSAALLFCALLASGSRGARFCAASGASAPSGKNRPNPSPSTPQN
ncbi:apolipoprotein N-acyltransferase [Desulfovibrio sp. SGI.169]|uniref:apolipoprotein N-acyltransferase n=1 Tax=Desulfovibrio sp. SGI.169 TaxID=3420561 RepID=UPI003CFE5959